ncbi:NAD(P)H-binding protein [Sphingomonas sp. MMS24-J13]|uniref:NAD(P)H-binding protein n=1 Tax=Sphingomonas sp. MMS24-J13 TaxID=3238686 RepID=UPI00384A7943
MIIVSGASGAFGRQAAELLIEAVDPDQLILTSRTPQKLIDLAERGAQVRYADFDDPSSLETAFAGGTRMLLISTARVGSRVGQHINAMTAAVKVGVRHIAYTSLLGVAKDGNPAIVKRDHLATEQALELCGAAWTFLRDSQYAEAIAGAMAPGAVATGRLPDNSTGGRIAFVSRDDCVAVAAAVLRQEGHENKAYDLTGPEIWTVERAMALVSELSGKPIIVEPVDDEGMFRHFDSLGIPRHASDEVIPGAIPWCSEDMVTFGQSIREGYFDSQTDHVERITGRPAKGLREVMMAFKDSWPA